MPSCVMSKCKSRSGRDRVGFFCIPTVITRECDRTKELSTKRRALWLARINRPNFREDNITHDTRVCSKHFVNKKPSALFDFSNVDWAPSLNLGHNSSISIPEAVEKERCWQERAEARREKRRADVAEALHQLDLKRRREQEEAIIQAEIERNEELLRAAMAEGTPGVGCQTDFINEDYSILEDKYNRVLQDNIALNKEVKTLKSRLDKLSMTEATLSEDDDRVKFYTGLSNFSLLMHVFNLVSSKVETSFKNSLPKFTEFMLVLMRLRLNLLEQDLAYRFGIHQDMVSVICDKWIRVLATRLEKCIFWPERDALCTEMPPCFKVTFGNSVCVIIDYIKVSTEQSSSPVPGVKTASNFKDDKFLKFLIGMTPQGKISFISKAWAGHASDKDITCSCGILEKLRPGDVVLADYGFDIPEDVGMYRAELHMPAFTKGVTKLPFQDVNNTSSSSNVRKHVERVIGLVRRKFLILQATLPVELLKPHPGDTLAPIDLIARVCCALINLCPPLS